MFSSLSFIVRPVDTVGFPRTRPAVPRGRRAAAAALLAALAIVGAGALLGGCAAPGPRLGDRVVFDDWDALPVGWERLDRIDRWLSAEGSGAPDGQRLEALLDLAEGRAALASLDRTTVAPEIVATRLELAALGFSSVLTDRSATSHQRYRAEEGLAAVEQLGFTLDRSNQAERLEVGYGGQVIARSTWRAAPADRANMTPASRWQKITIHHTAMPARHLLGGALGPSADTLRQIQRQHQQTNRWADIGYHFLIDPSGRVFEGRELAWQGAHAGKHPVTGVNFNPGNLGICLLGNFDTERPTPAALAALDGLVDDLRARHGIPRSAVYGHRHFKVTACPGTHLAAWLARYKAGIATSSSSASNPIAGVQPSAASFDGSPTISGGSPARTRSGSSSVR